MLEEGGDAGDLEAQAPGGASGRGESLVLLAGGGAGPRPGGAAAGGRCPEEQGEGRAGHHGWAGGQEEEEEEEGRGLRGAAGAGVRSRSPGGCRAAAGAEGSAAQKLNKKVQSSNSPRPFPPSPRPSALPRAGSGRAEPDRGGAIGCGERQCRGGRCGRGQVGAARHGSARLGRLRAATCVAPSP